MEHIYISVIHMTVDGYPAKKISVDKSNFEWLC
jgi:hypothetical protein